MTFDPRSTDFWDEKALDKEMRRVFDICNGCRRCLNLCPSFNVMFQALDTEAVDGDADKLTKKDFAEVVDLCYECRLCIPHCPYTPPHRWDLEFPRLMFRAKAHKAKTGRLTWKERFMANPDKIGRLGSFFAPISNWANRNPLNRLMLEHELGIHRDAKLPEFHRQRFSSWFKKHKAQSIGGNGKVALFHTCLVEYNNPEIGRAAVEILEKNNCAVICPEQKCCGMPFLDQGDIEGAINAAAYNVKHLKDAIDQGATIVAPEPTCSYMIKFEYPDLLGTEDARKVAAKTMDTSEFLMARHKDGKLDTNFVMKPGKIAYHIPCHLKVQNIGFKSRDLMALTGAQVDMIEKCSAHDGTWGIKKQYYQLSQKWGKPLFDAVEAAKPDQVVSDCSLSCLQIEHGTSRKSIHPLELIHQAYGLDKKK